MVESNTNRNENILSNEPSHCQDLNQYYPDPSERIECKLIAATYPEENKNNDHLINYLSCKMKDSIGKIVIYHRDGKDQNRVIDFTLDREKYTLHNAEVVSLQIREYFTEEQCQKYPVACINYAILTIRELKEGVPAFKDKIAKQINQSINLDEYIKIGANIVEKFEVSEEPLAAGA